MVCYSKRVRKNQLTRKRLRAMPSSMQSILAIIMPLGLIACGGGESSKVEVSSSVASLEAPSPTPSPSPSPASGQQTNTCATEVIPVSQLEGFCAENGQEFDGVEISSSRLNCIAPCGIFFHGEVQNSAMPEEVRSRMTFQWNFGDPDSAFDALPDGFPESFQDANAAQGQMAAHVFERPGSYNVKLFVTDGAENYSTSSVQVNVDDPDVVYAGADTLCYSKTGDFMGCPMGARHFNDASDAFAAVRSDQTRILLRSGEETLFLSKPNFRNLSDIQVGSFGEGAKPVLRIDASIEGSIFSPRDTNGLTIYGLEMRGDYDPTTGMGENYNESGIRNVGFARNVTVFRNSFGGLANAMLWIDETEAVVVADNTITDWYDYGVFDSSPNMSAYIGNSIKQNPEALSGIGSKNRDMIPRWADHGPIRAAEVDTLIIAQNDMFSNTGWSSNGQAHQPTIRYNTSGTRDHFGIINRNRLEGGFSVVALETQNTRTTANEGSVIFERNILIGSENTTQMISLGYGGTTIMNNLAVMPNVQNSFNPFRAFVKASDHPSSMTNSQSPIAIYHNSVVNLQDRNVFPFSVTEGFDFQSFLDVRFQRNLVYAPWVPNAEDFADYWPLDANDNFRPVEGSSAIGEAEGSEGVFDTLDGRMRPTDLTVGALEPT